MRFSPADSSSGSVITWVALRRYDSYADLDVTTEHVSFLKKKNEERSRDKIKTEIERSYEQVGICSKGART